MTPATTISISKTITVTTSLNGGGVVSTHKCGEFSEIIDNINAFVLNGLFKPSKLEKYHSTAEKLGFKIECVWWNHNAGFEGKNSDVVNFQASYTRV